MSETSQHLELTKSIINFVRERFSSENLALLTDLPGSSDKPPRIYGYVPDVFAEDAPRTVVIIGEAKTVQDLTTEHSRAQLTEFVRFLAAQPKGVFILAIPWPAAALARQIAEECLHRFAATRVEAVILDGVQARAAAGPRE